MTGEHSTSYRGSVASDVEYVTISHVVQSCRLKSEVLPSDSHPNVDGHQIPLQHGNNLVSIVLITFAYDDNILLSSPRHSNFQGRESF